MPRRCDAAGLLRILSAMKASEGSRLLHPVDERLRAFNFVIVARPKYSQPIWKRNGREYLQEDALCLITDEVVSLEKRK